MEYCWTSCYIKLVPYIIQSLIHLLIHSTNIYWVPAVCQVLVLGAGDKGYNNMFLFSKDLLSGKCWLCTCIFCHFCVGASGYELQQRGKGRGKLLECPHIAVSSHRTTRHWCPGLAELAVPSSAACNLLFIVSPCPGENNNLNVCASFYTVLSYLLFQLIHTVLEGKNYCANF